MEEAERHAFHEYFCTVGSGLEQFFCKELLNLGLTNVGDVTKGKVFFSSSLPVNKLLSLRTTERLFLLVHKEPQYLISHPKRKAILMLRDVVERNFRGKWDLSLKKWRDFQLSFPCPNLNKLSFRVSCKCSGQIRRAFPPAFLGKIIAGSLLNVRQKWTTNLRNPQLEVLVHANEDSLIIGLSCCPMDFPLSKRSYLPNSIGNTSLRPTICFAMIDCGLSRYKKKLSQVREECETVSNPQCNKQPLVIFDPMCGSGIILAEAVDFMQVSKYNVILLGSDCDEKQVNHASNNIMSAIRNSTEKQSSETLNSYVISNQCIPNLFVADARALPLKDNSVDIIISDIPFGLKHYGNPWKKELSWKEKMSYRSETIEYHHLKSFPLDQLYDSKTSSVTGGTILQLADLQETLNNKSTPDIKLDFGVESKEKNIVVTTEPLSQTDDADKECDVPSFKRRRVEHNKSSEPTGENSIKNMLPNLVAELDRVLKNGGQSVLLISENLKSHLLEAVNIVTNSNCFPRYFVQSSDMCLSQRDNLTMTTAFLSETISTDRDKTDNTTLTKNEHGWVCIEQHKVKLGILDAVICVFNK